MKVIETLQGKLTDDEGNLPEPVDMAYCTSDDIAEIMSAAASAIALANRDSRWTKVLAVRIEF